MPPGGAYSRRESWTDPLGYWQANVGGTLTLLGAMLAAETKRLVLAWSYGYRLPAGSSTASPSPSSLPCTRQAMVSTRHCVEPVSPPPHP
jgi:nucleoside-diphosphate-sugar epimerase